jgi:hypothetical protein
MVSHSERAKMLRVTTRFRLPIALEPHEVFAPRMERRR